MTATMGRKAGSGARGLAAVTSVAVLAAVSCSPGGADEIGSTGAGGADAVAGPVITQPAPATPARPSIRDGDITDVATLSSTMAAVATGDPEWIAVMADLRSRSWLAARYPGEYDLSDIYSPDWAADNAAPLQEESLELGVYLDEPLPVLESVVLTRELGLLIELEVVIRSEEAIVRTSDGDGVVTSLPGGRRRGLFSLGPATPDDIDRPWRIHSIAEMTPPADSAATPSTEAAE